MNLGELKTSVKRQFGDEAAIQVSDADILRWLEHAQDEIVIENEEIMDTRTTINLVTGVDEYAIPADLLTIRFLRIKESDTASGYVPVQFMSLAQFEKSVSGYEGFIPNTATSYIYTTYEGNIFLFPVPQVDVTDGLRLLYAKKPDVPSTDADPLGLPLAYHNAILQYCLVQAYEMDENWEASGNKLAQLQANLNRRANRAKDEERGTYPVITVLPEDM